MELLDQKEKLIATLTPEKGGSKGDGWIDDDATAQKHLVQLPEDQECIGCTVSPQVLALKPCPNPTVSCSYEHFTLLEFSFEDSI